MSRLKWCDFAICAPFNFMRRSWAAKKSLIPLSFCALVAGFSVAQTSSAAQLTWQITGDVNEVGTPLSFMFSPGDSVEIVFTFDTLAVDSNPSTQFGDYFGAMSSGRVTVGTYTALIEQHPIFVSNDVGGSPADLFGFSGLGSGTALAPDITGSDNLQYKFAGIYGHFQDTSASMFSSDSLPTSASFLNASSNQKVISIAWLANAGFGCCLMNGVSLQNIQLTDVTPIPEPEIYAMMGVGLGLLGWVGRRKKLQAAA